MKIGLLGALAGLCVIGGVMGAVAQMSGNATSPPEQAASVDDSIPMFGMEPLAQRIVGPHLREPRSAKFRNVSYRTRRTIPVLCGEVTGRNGFGGMTGFQHFVTVGDMVITEDEISPTKMQRLWHLYCVKTDAEDKEWPAMKAKLVAQGKLPAK